MATEDINQSDIPENSSEKPTASQVRSEYRHENDGELDYDQVICCKPNDENYPDNEKKSVAGKFSGVVKWVIFLIAVAIVIYLMRK